MNLLIDNRTDEPLTAELEDAIRRAAAEAVRLTASSEALTEQRMYSAFPC